LKPKDSKKEIEDEEEGPTIEEQIEEEVSLFSINSFF
jgi:hypothetical protein